MKKLVFLTFFILSIFILPAEESLFSFSAGITTGGVVYGSQVVNSDNSSVGNKIPFNFGTSFYINHSPVKEITFFLGTDFFFSFNASGTNLANHMTFNIPFGVKFYPHLKGFCFGSAYAPGFRTDYLKIEDMEAIEKTSAPWGNGFKFFCEYNFAHEGKSKYYPTLGISWTNTPRGSYTQDNLICFYLIANF